jgi:hypothetical protein
MVPFGASAVAQGVRDGIKFKTVNLDAAKDSAIAQQRGAEYDAQVARESELMSANTDKDILRQQMLAERAPRELDYEIQQRNARRDQMTEFAKNDPSGFNRYRESLSDAGKAELDSFTRGVDLTGRTEAVAKSATDELAAKIAEAAQIRAGREEAIVNAAKNQDVLRDEAMTEQTDVAVNQQLRAPEATDVADLLSSGVSVKSIVDDFDAKGIDRKVSVPILREAQNIARKVKLSAAQTAGMNFPEPIRKAPTPPQAESVVSASEMLTMEPKQTVDVPPVVKPIEQPIQQTTPVDQPVSGVNPPVESAPVAAQTTPVVADVPITTTTIVNGEPPVQRTQSEAPTPVQEKLKAQQDAEAARKAKLAAQRTAVAPEPVPRGAPTTEVATPKAEDWKVYEDPVTGNRKATQGEVPANAKVIPRTEKNATKYDAIVERSRESAKRDPWANRTRSGGTSVPSMIADATVDLAKSVVPSLKKIASGAGDIAKIPARALAMDSKFNLDKASAERIRQLEENTFRISDKHRVAIEKANKDTSFDFTDVKLANKLRDATNVPDGTMGNSYRSDFLDMVEGRKPVTPEFKPIVDAIWETNKFTRQMAIDNGVEVGKGFKNGTGMVRFWNSDIVNRIANEGVKDPVVKTLFDDIAARNNIPLQDVIDHFDKTVVIRDAAKAESIARLDPQELARKFNDVPTHIKDPNGGWLPVLNLDPNSYVNRVTQISTKRAAAKGSFSEGLDAFAQNAKLSPGEKKELSSAVADFYGIYERGIPDFALNHSKLVDYVTNATRIINNARLSASHAANITELTSMSMVAPPHYMMKGKAKYEVGVGGMTEGRGANTLDISKDAPLRGVALKVDRILRATGAQKIPTLVAQRMYSGIQKFYSDVNGKTSAWTEHYMEMADLSQDLRQKFRDGTATPEDIDVATTKAMRVATGRDLLGTQKAGMEHNWFARVLGPPYRGYSQKTIRNMWKATSQAYNVIRDPKIPLVDRAGIAASSLATAMVSQGINAASYNALRAVLAGSFGAMLYEMNDRRENLNLQNFAWLTSNIIGGGPIGTLLEQSSKEGNISLQSGMEMAMSPYSAGSAAYKAATGGSIAEGAMGMVPIVNKARKLASGEGKIEFAKNQFYRVMNELEGKPAPDAAEMTPLNAAAKSLRNAVESGDGEQAALRELVAAARLEARTRRVDVNDVVTRKLDGMRTLQKYESKLMNSESPEDRKKLRELRTRIPEDMRRDLLQFDRKIERLKARFED